MFHLVFFWHRQGWRTEFTGWNVLGRGHQHNTELLLRHVNLAVPVCILGAEVFEERGQEVVVAVSSTEPQRTWMEHVRSEVEGIVALEKVLVLVADADIRRVEGDDVDVVVHAALPHGKELVFGGMEGAALGPEGEVLVWHLPELLALELDFFRLTEDVGARCVLYTYFPAVKDTMRRAEKLRILDDHLDDVLVAVSTSAELGIIVQVK